MALRSAFVTIPRDVQEVEDSTVGIRLERASVSGLKGKGTVPMVLLFSDSDLLPPAAGIGNEPRSNRIVCGLSLRTSEGTTAEGTGQLVITGRRLIGMIGEGSCNSTSLNANDTGLTFCFSFERENVGAPAIKKRMLKASDIVFQNAPSARPTFELKILDAMAYIANNQVGYWHDRNLLFALSDEGRADLLA